MILFIINLDIRNGKYFIFSYIDFLIGKLFNEIPNLKNFDCIESFLYGHNYLNTKSNKPLLNKFSSTRWPNIFRKYVTHKPNKRALCGDVAAIGFGLSNQNNCNSRLYFLFADNKPKSLDTHVFGEVFSKKYNKFVVVDPTFNTLYSCQRNYIMSLDELIECKRSKKKIFPVNKFGNHSKESTYYDYYISLEDLMFKIEKFEGHSVNSFKF